jgi:hypothetical protein
MSIKKDEIQVVLREGSDSLLLMAPIIELTNIHPMVVPFEIAGCERMGPAPPAFLSDLSTTSGVSHHRRMLYTSNVPSEQGDTSNR